MWNDPYTQYGFPEHGHSPKQTSKLALALSATGIFQPPETIDSILADAIPGFHEMKQRCPAVGCMSTSPYLRDAIIHLNDAHEWPRERIADWLDTLDHDLTFKVPGGGEME